MVAAQTDLAVVNPAQIRPYASAILLEFTGNDPESAVSGIVRQLKILKSRERYGRTVTIIASGLTLRKQLTELADSAQQEPGSRLMGSFEVRQPPNWATVDSQLTQITLDLTVLASPPALAPVQPFW